MKITIFIAAVLFLVFSCAQSPDVKEHEVYEIRNVGTLSTTEYTLGKVVKTSDEAEWYKYGDRKILMSCKARVKAGIDLAELRDEDIKTSGSRIEITLPPAKIVSFEMDPNEVRTEMTEITGFRWNFSQTDKQKIMQLGEKAIRKDLDQLNILRDAENNAKTFVRDFYRQLGFEEVIVHGSNKVQRISDAD
jgi:hypothetical protein